MLIYVDPGQPNLNEKNNSEEFQKTLERYIVTDWKPESFSDDNMVLSVQLKFNRPELISQFLKKDKIIIALGPELTEVILSEEGQMLEN